MSGSLVTEKVGHHLVVFGLHWEDLRSTGRAMRTEAGSLAKRDGTRHGVLQTTRRQRNLVGLLTKGAPASAQRAFSAAAWLAESVQAPTLVIHQLPGELYWIGVVDDGCLIDGDQVLDAAAAETRIDRALADLARKGKQAEVYVSGETYPEAHSLQTVEWQPRDLKGIFGEVKPTKAAQLQQLHGLPPAVLKGALAAGVAAIALVGLKMYRDNQAELAAQEAAQAVAQGPSLEELEQIREQRIQAAVSVKLREHTGGADPREQIAACLEAYRRVSAGVVGWRMREMVCDGTAPVAQAIFDLPMDSSSTAELLLRRFEAAGFPAPQLGTGGADATVSIPLHAPSARTPLERESLPTVQASLRRVGTRAHVMGQVQSARQWQLMAPAIVPIVYLDPEKEKNPEDPTRFVQVPPERGYQQALMTITGNQPWQLMVLPLSMPYVGVKKVSLRPDAAGLNWSVEAFYVAI